MLRAYQGHNGTDLNCCEHANATHKRLETGGSPVISIQALIVARVRARVRVRPKCIYINRGVHTYYFLRDRVSS